MTTLITGVSSGLGQGLAEVYLADGHEVYGLSRRTPDTLVRNPSFHFLGVDLGDAHATTSALPEFLKKINELDTIYLNAGVLGQVRDLKDCPLDELRQQMDVNLWANKLILDALRDAHVSVGQVLTLSSGAAVNGNRGWNGYSISKAALNMFTHLYAQEWPETHFTAFAPGLVDTAMQDYLCGEVDTGRYPSVQKLIDARGTEDMPQPQEAARRIIEALPKLKQLPSGSFADIRKL
ncbi:MAG: SDR family NAD(P)-dependent oxidoreductase [Verrucomicrobiota bacterium]